MSNVTGSQLQILILLREKSIKDLDIPYNG